MQYPYLFVFAMLFIAASALAAEPDIAAPQDATLSPAAAPEAASEARSAPAAPTTTPAPAIEAEPPPAVSRAELDALSAGLAADQAAAKPLEADSAPAVGGSVGNSNPDIALILDAALAWFDGEPDQLGAHDPSESGFNLQQLEMNISSNVDPYFRLEANLVFSEFGVEVEEAYATTLALPANLQIRGGQFLTRFGRLNASHPHSWNFVDQPLVNGKFFGGEGSRGLGTELSWLSPLPWYAEVVSSAHMARGACCARSFFGGDDLGVETPADLLYTTALKQFFPITRSLSVLWGLSGQFGPNASGNGNRSEIYGTDLYIHYRPTNSAERSTLTVQAEAMYRTRQLPGDRLEDIGGYAQAVWKINPTWEVGARHGYVAGLENDPLDPEWTADRNRSSAQVTYYPSHFSRLRLQGNRDDRGDGEVVWGGFLAAEWLIGAHGAHKF